MKNDWIIENDVNYLHGKDDFIETFKNLAIMSAKSIHSFKENFYLKKSYL